MVARAIGRQVFMRRAIIMVPNCSWTGFEADLLVISHHGRLIDLEIKRSAADLRADAGKDKWWAYQPSRWDPRLPRRRVSLQWPPRVWKHWYAVDAKVFKPADLAGLSEASGVMTWKPHGGSYLLTVIRQPQPNRKAEPISTVEALDLCRLSNLRLWDEYQRSNSKD